MLDLTITAYSDIAVNDELGLSEHDPDARFLRSKLKNGESATYTMTDAAWERVRPRLDALVAQRIPARNGTTNIANATMAPLRYSIVRHSSGGPRLQQVELATAPTTYANGVLTLRGENLLNGKQASLEIRDQSLTVTGGPTGTVDRFSASRVILTITAVPYGPVGNNIKIRIVESAASASVSTRIYENGRVEIVVVPLTGSRTAADIAAQIAADADASVYITATSVVDAAVVPQIGLADNNQRSPQVQDAQMWGSLSGGDGGGLAFCDIPVSAGVATNRLRLTAQKAGNEANQILFILSMEQGSNSVSVIGNTITVTRTAATVAIGTLASAINANADAATLVSAAAVGSGSLSAITGLYLLGGSGPTPTAKVGGTDARISDHTNTSMVLNVLAADLSTASIAANEQARIEVLFGDLVLSAQYEPNRPVTLLHFPDLSNGNYISAYAAGSPLDDAAGPWTRFIPARTVSSTVGASGVAHNLTVTGTHPITGDTITEVIAATGAGTFQGNTAFGTITRIQTNVNPGDTVTLKAGAGLNVGRPVTAFSAVGVDQAYEAPAGSSSAANGTVRFTTVPNGSRDYTVVFY